MYGLKKGYIQKIKSVLAKSSDIENAILYGSRAKGNYREGYDIDICLVGRNLTLNTLLRVETELDDLLLPCNIDVSIFEKIENSDLTEHIKRVGVVIYEKQ